MKKFSNFFKWLFLYTFIIVFVLSVIFIFGGKIYEFFIKIWERSDCDVIKFIINVLSIPFAIIGAIQAFRGYAYVLDKDDKRFKLRDTWARGAVYLLITTVGYLALFYLYKHF